jgi:predicted PurR-regulated permease PerM
MIFNNSFKDTLFSSDGLRTTLVVIFVAFTLTIYELYMFYFVVVPSVKQQIDNGIKDIYSIINNKAKEQINKAKEQINTNITPEIKKQIYDGIKNKTKEQNILDLDLDLDQTDNINKILEVLNEREELLTSKINNYTKLSGSLILLTLIIIMILICYTIYGRNEVIGNNTVYVSLFTLILIMGFQYFFYYFGKNYFFIDGKELIEYIYLNL